MTVRLPDPVTEHAAWQAYRRSLKGIGASDAPNILGIGYRTPFETWELLTGRREPDDSPRMARGRRLEAVAAAWLAEETGWRLRRIGTQRDPRWPHLFAHPDRIAPGKRLIEIKTHHRDFEPDARTQAQVQPQMLLSGAVVTTVTVMTFDALYQHDVPFDRAAAEKEADYLEAWYARHIEADVPPLDVTDPRYLRWLGQQAEAEGRAATPDELRLIASIREARTAKAAAERDEAEYRGRLIDSMAGATELTGPGFHITWRRTKDRTVVGWKELAGTYRAALAEAGKTEAELDTIADLYTHTEEGNRPFRLTFEEDER